MVISADESRWSVPANVNFTKGPKAADLYNECSGATPSALDDARVRDLPVITVDPVGEVITGFLLADNYFELYVNGKLVAVDPVAFTPFNSAIVRSKARRPVTYAVKLVDWKVHRRALPDSGRPDFPRLRRPVASGRRIHAHADGN